MLQEEQQQKQKVRTVNSQKGAGRPGLEAWAGAMGRDYREKAPLVPAGPIITRVMLAVILSTEQFCPQVTFGNVWRYCHYLG